MPSKALLLLASQLRCGAWKAVRRTAWVHEIKHDGYRLMIWRDGDRMGCSPDEEETFPPTRCILTVDLAYATGAEGGGNIRSHHVYLVHPEENVRERYRSDIIGSV
jgi:hypothetical protein